MSLRRRLERLEASAPAAPEPDGDNGGGCEDRYFHELAHHEAGESNLIHDPEAEAFYTAAGEFALSRHRVDVRAWVNA